MIAGLQDGLRDRAIGSWEMMSPLLYATYGGDSPEDLATSMLDVELKYAQAALQHTHRANHPTWFDRLWSMNPNPLVKCTYMPAGASGDALLTVTDLGKLDPDLYDDPDVEIHLGLQGRARQPRKFLFKDQPNTVDRRYRFDRGPITITASASHRGERPAEDSYFHWATIRRRSDSRMPEVSRTTVALGAIFGNKRPLPDDKHLIDTMFALEALREATFALEMSQR